MRQFFAGTCVAAVVISCLAVAAWDVLGQAPPPAIPLAELADRLKNAGDVRIDIELKSGRSMLRLTVLQVTVKDGAPVSLRVQEGAAGKAVSISFSAIRTISIDRQEIYAAAASDKKIGKEAVAERTLALAAAEREKWTARAKERGVEPWPELSKEEHDDAEAEVRENIKKIRAEFPKLLLYQTTEFLLLSDLPRDHVLPYATSLDKMYDLMCDMYSLRKGTQVFKGKCLVVIFLEQDDFFKYEIMFHRFAPHGAQGLCHNGPDGDVIMSCFRGDSPEFLGQVIVHETSHGFVHRYRTDQRLPRWANEGLADYIAKQLVLFEGGIRREQAIALNFLRQTRNMQNVLREMKTDSLHYGMSCLLTEFMIKHDKAKYKTFIDGIKEGLTWEDSLRESYKATPEQLVTAFGKSVGIPDLQP
jgi:hypothetical protein